MNPVLIVVETQFGQCGKIADHVALRVRSRGHEIYLEQSPGAHPVPLYEYSAVIVIAAVYNGRHPDSIEQFVRSHASALSACPTAFLSVSIGTASRSAWVRAGAARVARQLLETTGWERPHVLLTGGCIAYPLYTPSVRRWMRVAAWLFGLPTDTSKSHELTSWSSVDDTVDEVLADLETIAQRTRPASVA